MHMYVTMQDEQKHCGHIVRVPHQCGTMFPFSNLCVVAVSETWKMEEFLTLTKEHSLVKKGRALGATGYVGVIHCFIPNWIGSN